MQAKKNGFNPAGRRAQKSVQERGEKDIGFREEALVEDRGKGARQGKDGQVEKTFRQGRIGVAFQEQKERV